MKLFLIDVGSTFIKYSIYTAGAHSSLTVEKVGFPAPTEQDGRKYIVPEPEIKDIILRLFSVAAENGCVAAYISVQMHGYLLKDANGRLSDYVSWRDKSGDIENASVQEIDFYVRGTSLKDNLPFVKLCGMAHTLAGAELYTLGSYISYLLTGKNITHSTDACASGFYCATPLHACRDVEGLALPDACDDVKIIGSYRGMDIYAPVGDHQASFLGSMAGEDKYLLNVGTAAQLSCLGSKDYPAGAYERRPFFEKDKSLLTVSGLRVEAVNEGGLENEKFATQMESALRILPAKSGVIFGGGGGKMAYDRLRERLNGLGLLCEVSEKSIGLEGLKMLAEKNAVKVGAMLSEIAFSNFPILLKNNNIDFFILDNEHGAFDYSAITGILMNAKLTEVQAIVRLGSNQRENIIKLADAGAAGFLLPMTNEAEDIARLVEYAKYPPVGRRGVSTMRAHTLYNPPDLKDYMALVNKTLKVYAQIETARGMENLREILNVPGVDGVMLGPNDLSVDLDCIGDNKPLIECMRKIAEETADARKIWGIITTNKELVDAAKFYGADMISYGSELNMLNAGCKKIKELI